MYPWHRLFGIALTDLLAGTAWEVVLEMDLSVKQQRLDFVVVRRTTGPQPKELPDGFEPLADHNLITYKSLREPLDGWALKELAAHSVNYRKQVSPPLKRLLPEESFRLVAICTRFPRKLANQITWQQVKAGVYDIRWGTDTIRALVLNEFPPEVRNIYWNLFSANRERIDYAAERFRQRPTSDASSLLKMVYHNYQAEGFPMPFTKEDFLRDVRRMELELMTPEERVAGISPEELRAIALKMEQHQARPKAQTKLPTKPRAKSRRTTKQGSH